MSRIEFKDTFCCGVLCALVTSAFGGGAMQWAFFAFGCTYSVLWIKANAIPEKQTGAK